MTKEENSAMTLQEIKDQTEILNQITLFNFEETELGGTDVDSMWKQLKLEHQVECGSQCDLLFDATTAEIDVQTDDIGQEAGCQTAFNNDHFEEVKSNPLIVEFIQIVVPRVIKELNNALESHAFDDYSVVWEKGGDVINKMHDLKVPTIELELQSIMATSWSASGNTIAVAFGRDDHRGWCENHRASLSYWNLVKRNFDVNIPEGSIELENCLLSISFHPIQPSIIAGGLFTGELRVWDLADAMEPLVASSTIDDFFHREPISEISWLRSVFDHEYQIVTAGGDGKILFWSLSNKLACPCKGAIITPTREITSRSILIGATSFCFSRYDFNHYVVTTENGDIFRGNQLNANRNRTEVVKDGSLLWKRDAWTIISNIPSGNRSTEIKRHIEKWARLHSVKEISAIDIFASRPDLFQLFPSASFPDSTNSAFESHSGPVFGSDFSQFHRNLFLTCSTDGTIRLYHVFKSKPLMYLQPTSKFLYDIAWSPIRPTVFATVSSEGILYIYDLQRNIVTPIISFSVSDTPLRSVSFNPKMHDLIAVGDANGVTTILQLCERLCVEQPNERYVLTPLENAHLEKNHVIKS